MNTFDASTITIYSTPEYGDQVIFTDKSVWTIKQREQMSWGLYAENNIPHSAIGLHRGMNEFCRAINDQDEFLKFALKNPGNTSVHRGEHYI